MAFKTVFKGTKYKMSCLKPDSKADPRKKEAKVMDGIDMDDDDDISVNVFNTL